MNYAVEEFGFLEKASAKKGVSFLIVASLVLSLSMPFILLPTEVNAAPVPLFSDNFDQGGSGLVNGWQTVSGFDTPSRTGTNSVTSPNALNFKGGTGPDDAAERNIATKGNNDLLISYKVRSVTLDNTESFTANYYLDGILSDSQSFISSSENETISQDIVKSLANPLRNTKLTVRFTVNANSASDVIGIDDLNITGDGAPNFYDGFETYTNTSNFTSSGIWSITGTPTLDTSGDSWTDSKAVVVDGSSPNDKITKTFNTTGLESIHVRYSRVVEDLEEDDNDVFKARYALIQNPEESDWVNFETLDDDDDNSPYASLMFSLPSGANDNEFLKIRFEMNGDSSDDNAFIDDVVIWADVAAPTTGSITVEKIVTKPNDEEADDGTGFTVMLNGGDSQTLNQGNNVTYTDLVPGQYTILETQDENYEAPVYSVDENTEVEGAQITVSAGTDTLVTITNKQKMAHITVNKTVDNSHALGTNVAEDFSFQVNGGEETFYEMGEEGSLTATKTIAVPPGTYTITETDNLGYAVGYENCTSLVLTSNGETTCNITNYDLEPGKGALTVIKDVVRDHGGNEATSEFTLTVTPEGDDPITVTSGQVSQFVPGTYTVAEIMSGTLADQYTQTSLVCMEGENTVANPVVLEAGKVYECVITNDDKPALLTIIKNTTGADGTFAFEVDGVTPNTTVTTTQGNGQVTIELNKGSYDVVELAQAGWTFTGSFCEYEGESEGQEIQNGEHIYVDNGEEVTCTFSNTRQMGSLTVIKNVVTTDENVTAEDFQIHVIQGETEVAGSPQAGQGGEGTTYSNLPTGSYTLTETGGPENYVTTFSENCPAGVVTVTNSETPVTCTITNTFNPTPTQGKITVTKVVINDNGGTKVIADFPLFVNTTAVVSGVENSFAPGTYTVGETQSAGYTAVISGDEGCEGPFTLAAGDVKNCIITNDDVAPSGGSNPPSGGGGGGGGGVSAPTLIIFDESIKAPSITETSLTLTWDTNMESSSYVVYSAEGQNHSLDLNDNAGTPPKYGYANATEEINTAPKVMNHSVTVNGLTTGVTYYFRLVSRGSMAYSNEYKITPGATVLGTTTVNPGPGFTETTPAPDNGGSGGGGSVGIGSNSTSTGGSGSPVVEEPTIGSTLGETSQPLIAENTPDEEEGSGQTAALGEATGFAGFLQWLGSNFWWILLLLIILAIMYYYYKKMQQNQQNVPPQQ